MEHYYEGLFQYIEKIIHLPEHDKVSIRKYFKAVFAAKGTIIECAGEVPEFHNFIVSGHMRSFHLDTSNQEVITDLNEGPRFFTSYNSFMNRTVSEDSLQCITDCEILRINRQDVEEGAHSSLTQKDFTIHILQMHLRQDKQRIYDMANLTAEARYIKFLRENPNILRNVPLRYIASYLGITQRHLSRLRGDR